MRRRSCGATQRSMKSWKRAIEYGVGQKAFRLDVREKVLGYGEYPDDVEMEGMVYASAMRSRYARARILDIRTEEALALPGVLAVLTAEDVPNNKVGHLQQDWDVMIAKGSITRGVGTPSVSLWLRRETSLIKQRN